MERNAGGKERLILTGIAILVLMVCCLFFHRESVVAVAVVVSRRLQPSENPQQVQQVQHYHQHKRHHRKHRFGSTEAYNCTESERVFQWSNIDLAVTSICDTISPYQFAQLVYPDAKTFIDVGANRGYVSGNSSSILFTCLYQ